MVESEPDAEGMYDVRLLSLLLSLTLVRATMVGAVGLIGKENRLTSARTGCAVKSDIGRTFLFLELERTTLGSSATESKDSASEESE